MVDSTPLRAFIESGHQETALFDGMTVAIETAGLRVQLARIGDWVVANTLGCGPTRIAVPRGGPRGLRDKYVALSLMLAGDARDVVRAATRLSARPGELALYAMNRAATFEFSGRFRFVVICIPWECMQSMPLVLDTPISAEHGAGAVLAAAVRALALEAGRHGEAEHLHPLLDGIASLTVASFDPSAKIAPPLDSLRLRRSARIRDHMAARLADRGLQASDVARACGMSLRTLHRALHEEGETFAALRLRMRLENAAARLGQAATQETIGEVARSCGFESDSHFSRAFKAAYAIGPRAFRAEARRLGQAMT